MAPPYTNQHYVPQSYLRGWTYDETEKGSIFLIKQQREIKWQNIDEICSSDDFNSQYKPLEIMFGRLEDAHAAVFNRIRDGDTLRSLSIGERRLLLSFAVTQRMRSSVMRTEIEDGAEKFIDEALQEDIPNLGLDTDEFSEAMENWSEDTVLATHHSQMMSGILAPFGMYELEGVVLENTSEEPFITSEAPVIFENPRFKKERDMNYPGMSDGGLQIYCPISPTQCILFYDPEIYWVSRDRRWHAEVSDPEDIRELNMLQVFATNSFLIYKETGQTDRMISLIEEARRYEDWRKIERVYRPISEEGEPSVYSFEPAHQLHDLVPTPDSVNCYPGTTFRRREVGENAERYLIHKILSQADFSERAVIHAIVFMLKNAGIDPQTRV